MTPATATGAPFGLMALDGADDDGGTLYVLYDGDRPVLSAAWPMPLEAHAARHGRTVERVQPIAPALDWGPDDFDDHRELMADLMAEVARIKEA